MIYCDHAATTPLDPRVYQHMAPLLQHLWGNPSSPHSKGREARAVIDQSRVQMTTDLGCKPQEIVYVASGSEANTLAIRGVCDRWAQDRDGKPGTIITLATEHKCTLLGTQALEQMGWNIVELAVDSDGVLNTEDLRTALDDQTALVTIHWANNETGAVQPIEEIAAVCKEAGVPFHCDAVQPIGILEIPSPLPDLFSITAHKFYGPKGIGALVVREDIELAPMVRGGGQEFGLRAGTENAPAIAGMAKALELAVAERATTEEHLRDLQKVFVERALELPGVSVNGPADRLPSITNLHFAGQSGETLVIKLDQAGVCASTGSACTTGSTDPSHVLLAMGRSTEESLENVRFSFGRGTTKNDIGVIVDTLSSVV